LLQIKDEIIGKLDFPNEDEKIYRPGMLVQGWAFSKKANDLSVRVLVDGKLTSRCIWGLARYDVFKNFKTEEGYRSGFISRVDIQNLPDGKHEIKVIANSNDEEKLLGTLNIVKGEKIASDKINPSGIAPAGQPGEFNKMAKQYFQYFIQLGKLETNHKVLEVGCGMGRMAMPLTQYLTGDGQYHSIDIIPQAIEYCQKNITSRFPNFQFKLANVNNKMYNPEGPMKASEYKFPYNDNFFNFVFLASVFTHIIPEDMENYLSEISRVLKKDGRCFITFFIVNKEKLEKEKNIQESGWIHKFGRYISRYGKLPEKAIAFDESYIRKLYDKFNLQIDDPIHFGSWHGIKNTLAKQDIIIATKS